jgi:hypothetical protein
MSRILPNSIDETLGVLAQGEYVAERSLATAVFLALRMLTSALGSPTGSRRRNWLLGGPRNT